MRQISKWFLFYLFWTIFFSSLLAILYNLIFTSNYQTSEFITESIIASIAFLLSIISLNYRMTFTSPKLGRKILHYTGTYYVDFRIERYASDIKTYIYIYKDRFLFKKSLAVTHVYYGGSEDDLATEISKCLQGIEKEYDFRKKLKLTKNKVIDLLSPEMRRHNRVKSICD